MPYEVREGVLVQYGRFKGAKMLFFSWPSKTMTIKSDSTCQMEVLSLECCGRTGALFDESKS